MDKSMQQGLMVCLAVSLPVVTSDTTQSMISSNERWHQQRHRPYWSQHRSVAVTAKDQTPFDRAVDSRTLHLHLSRHTGFKPPQQSCRGSQCSCERGGREKEVKVQQSVSNVRLHNNNNIIISCLYYSQDTRSTNICRAGQHF